MTRQAIPPGFQASSSAQNLETEFLNRHPSHVSTPITKAFLLGAGLGTRLRPLTNELPKPLIPVFHRPLIHHALDHCLAAGIREFAINTHHLPEKWDELFRGCGVSVQAVPAASGEDHISHGQYRDTPITFFHEPDLLETGGGIKNIEEWICGEPIVVYNGDILSTLDLNRLIATHSDSEMEVTLAVRSTGPALHIAVGGARITDIHRLLGVAEGTHQFTGIYCLNPEFLGRLPAREKVSVIPTFLELAKGGNLGASLHDEGQWLDLGCREAYLDAHRIGNLGNPIHQEATIDPTAMVEASVVGPGASIGPDAVVLNTVLWPNTQIAGGAQLTNCIVYSSTPATGAHHNADL
jgi:NDP-sugar pyrophosphorylase family protein